MKSDKYNQMYVETHDIDWFCRIGNTAIHCASNGGALPDKVDNKERNRKIQEEVAGMPNVVNSQEEVVINRAYVETRLGNREAFDSYTSSFVAMAMKGFVSFDRLIDDDAPDTYVWIARPSQPVNMDIDLPTYDEQQCPAFADGGEYLHVECLNEIVNGIYS